MTYGSPLVRIGVFGGTFDPLHIGHLVAAVNVRHVLGLDRVIFVVANDPWQKVDEREITPAAVRLDMVRASLADVDGCEVSELELARGGPSYTADTLAELQQLHPGSELFLILGSDAASGLPTWERHGEIPALAHVVVVDRPGRVGERPPEDWVHTVVECPMLDVSSTDIRRRVRSGEPIRFLVPPAVETTIEGRQLYR